MEPEEYPSLKVRQIPETLSEAESKELLRLERKVERAFHEAGAALFELREKRLYRDRYRNFEDYCQDRFGYSRRKIDYLIAGAQVYSDLENMRTRTNCSHLPLPTRESQTRSLIGLDCAERWKSWYGAVEEAGGKIPTAKILTETVQRLYPKQNKKTPKPIPNPWRVGDVAILSKKSRQDPSLKGKQGCWAIVEEVLDFSCNVRLWDGIYQVKPNYLEDTPYSEGQQKQMRLLCDRMGKIPLDPEKTSPAVLGFLAGLGKLNRYWLTDLEEAMLKTIEGQSDVSLST